MAINRNAYKSLVESVQEATTAPSMGKTPSKPSKTATKSVSASINTASIAEENLIEWPITIGGRTATNARELAQILNSMQNDKQSGSSPSVPTGVAGASRKTNTPSTPKQSISKTMGATPIAENEQWDILDEILAEGLELYGEEGLEEILTSFAVSGEMSQELADLLGAE